MCGLREMRTLSTSFAPGSWGYSALLLFHQATARVSTLQQRDTSSALGGKVHRYCFCKMVAPSVPRSHGQQDSDYGCALRAPCCAHRAGAWPPLAPGGPRPALSVLGADWSPGAGRPWPGGAAVGDLEQDTVWGAAAGAEGLGLQDSRKDSPAPTSTSTRDALGLDLRSFQGVLGCPCPSWFSLLLGPAARLLCSPPAVSCRASPPPGGARCTCRHGSVRPPVPLCRQGKLPVPAE